MKYMLACVAMLLLVSSIAYAGPEAPPQPTDMGPEAPPQPTLALLMGPEAPPQPTDMGPEAPPQPTLA